MLDERAVFVTQDGFGRGSIVRRSDGLFEIYEHWLWDEETRHAFNVAPGGRISWDSDYLQTDGLYEDIEPQPGIYGTVDDAIRGLMAKAGFEGAKRVL